MPGKPFLRFHFETVFTTNAVDHIGVKAIMDVVRMRKEVLNPAGLISQAVQDEYGIARSWSTGRQRILI